MRDVHAGPPQPARSLILAGLAAALALGASGPAAHAQSAGGEPAQSGPREVTLFISPFGEPFTGAPTGPFPVAAWFDGADADHDGVVGWNEFEADGRRWFGQVDADGSSRIDPAEIAAYEVSLHRFGGGMRRGGPGWGGGRGGGLALAGQPQSRAPTGSHIAHGGEHEPLTYGTVAEAGFFDYPEPVKAADVNTDSRITAEEWARATATWFRALDTDHDGRLTLATLPRTPLQARVEAERR